jgi:hypothetical protein
MKLIPVLITTTFVYIFSFTANAQVSVTFIEPVSSVINNGSIIVHGLTANTTYNIITYERDGVTISLQNKTTASNSTDFTIDSLGNGIYNNIVFLHGTTQTVVPGLFILGRIASQSIKFLGAGYANFTGVADDDPSGFTQVYAMLSQPLNKIYGINSDANFSNRFIPLRNLFFQLTYGNTDKFKMYSYDTLNSKYVNRLDLLAHAYLDAKMSLNLLTLILPKKNHSTNGDLCHVYLNGTLAFLATNVTDTLTKDISATTKTYAVHSLMFGGDITGKFEKIFNSNFQIQIGFKMFCIYPSTSTFNPALNPQSTNVKDIYNAQNNLKSLEHRKSPLYYNLDGLISYNTASDPSKSTSNVFLHYSLTSNLAKTFGKNFANNYFQFQIGYALDISKILSAKDK